MRTNTQTKRELDKIDRNPRSTLCRQNPDF